MHRSRWLLVSAFVAGALAVGVVALTGGSEEAAAGPEAAPEPEAQAEQDSGPQYSPFVVHVRHGDAPFDVISFKDVGMSVSRADRQHVYESIAQSLSYELASHAKLPMSSEVRYSEAVADPENHKHCEGRHIYVDVWQAASSERWGYSLWSGCGEDDQFAWKELPASGGRSGQVEPLTRDIAASLRDAVETGCFTKLC